MWQVFRVMRGQGDQYDSRARARGVTASFSLNGIGLVPEEPPDLYQENEELKVRHTNAPFPFLHSDTFPKYFGGQKGKIPCAAALMWGCIPRLESSVMCARQTQLKQTGIPRIRGIPIKLFCRPF
jgi:hypothetical protein